MTTVAVQGLPGVAGGNAHDHTGGGGTGIPVGGLASGVLRAGKNWLINGNMEIWQRGTSFTPTTAGAYTADRWLIVPAGATCSAGINTTVPANKKSRSSLYIEGDSSVTTVDFKQRIEAANAINLRKTLTLSFWLYAIGQAAAFKPRVMINTANAVDNFVGGVTNRVNEELTDCTLNGWKQYTYTFSGDQVDAEKGLEVVIRLPSGSMGSYLYYAFFSQVQLEEGSVASDFDQRDVATETALCQRYYQVAAAEWMQKAALYNTNHAYIVTTLVFPVQMRAVPTTTGSSIYFWSYPGAGGAPRDLGPSGDNTVGITYNSNTVHSCKITAHVDVATYGPNAANYGLDFSGVWTQLAEL